jgi:hypothetical protein
MKWDLRADWKTENLINKEKDTDDSGLEDLIDKSYKKFIKKTYEVITHVEKIGLPTKNEQIRLVTFRSFNAVHFLKYIADLEGVLDVKLAVYSINAEAAIMINELIENKTIEKATILISNLRNKAHRTKEQITRDLFVNNPNIDLFFCSSHAKIMSIKTKKGNFYTIEGSGNLSYNSRVEQYCLDNDEELFNFTEKWMQEIKKHLQGKKELILT